MGFVHLTNHSGEASRNIEHLGVYFRKMASDLDELCENYTLRQRENVLHILHMQMWATECSIKKEGFHLVGTPTKIMTGLYCVLGLLVSYRIHVATRGQGFEGPWDAEEGDIPTRLLQMIEDMTGCRSNVDEIALDSMDYEAIIECRRLFEELEGMLPQDFETGEPLESIWISWEVDVDWIELRGIITRVFDDIGTSWSCATCSKYRNGFLAREENVARDSGLDKSADGCTPDQAQIENEKETTLGT